MVAQSSSLWIFPEAEAVETAAAVESLARELRLPAALAGLLLRRGYADPARALAFLNPRIEDLLDPFLLRDMDRAVERIRAAIDAREIVEIHGDYDVDGVTSTVILKKALEMAGAQCGWHIPHRLHDGYGMQPEAVEEAARRGVRLIVSVDNGIRAGAAIRAGQRARNRCDRDRSSSARDRVAAGARAWSIPTGPIVRTQTRTSAEPGWPSNWRTPY